MSETVAERSRLLVSVRSPAEALAALAGGADLIDVKEPGRGALGRADDETIAAIVRQVAGRRPVSAALGELADWRTAPGIPAARLAFVKWGLAGCSGDWAGAFEQASAACAARRPAPQRVVTAYADWERAQAPSVLEVSDFAVRTGRCLLIDTFIKDGSTLLDWLPTMRLAAIRRRCREAGVPIALAGSLQASAIAGLLELQPDWFAVRGAACRQGQRSDAIDPERVRALRTLLDSRQFSETAP